MAVLDLVQVRAKFPSLRSGFIYADNAGGSQCSREVIDRIVDYLSNTNVQLCTDYSVGVQSNQRVASGVEAAALLFNAPSVDEVGFGPSSSMIFENIARAMDHSVNPGDEFIITEEHEANCGPWKRLAERRGAVVKYWCAMPTSDDNPYSLGYKLDDLLALVSSKTRLVAITACSNILGSIMPIEEIVRALRKRTGDLGAPKVEVSVDCVAYAPHRRVDVQKWDVDYCVLSLYKVYGTHHSIFYARSTVLNTSLSKIVHHFLQVDSIPYKLEIGGPGYELVYSATGVIPYLLSLTPDNDLDASFEAIAEHERQLLRPLLSFLAHKKQYERGVRIVGTSEVDQSRVPTVSFVVTGQNSMKSKDIVSFFDKKGGIGIRNGHFYAYTLVANMKPQVDVDDGVVRISLVHYNTVEEVERMVDVLEEALA